MSRSSHRNQAGFSLLEVLVSLAVVALTVGVAIRVYGQAANSAARGERALRALMTAESVLAEHGATIPLEAGTRRGQAGDGLRWKSVVVPYDGLGRERAGRLPVEPFEVKLTVFWGEGDGRSLTLRALKIGGRNGGR